MSVDYKAELLKQIDEQQALRAEYANRPFLHEYEELEKRLFIKCKKLLDNPDLNEKDPLLIEVTADEHRLIWREINAVNRMHGVKEQEYNPDSWYMLHNLFTVKLKK